VVLCPVCLCCLLHTTQPQDLAVKSRVLELARRMLYFLENCLDLTLTHIMVATGSENGNLEKYSFTESIS